METHAKRVEAQFGSAARDYLTSTVHSKGADLDLFRSLLEERSPSRLLDIGCGAGHLTYAAAATAQSVVAYDASPEMLRIVENEATTRGLTNISTVLGRAETLPFEAESFDWICTRYSAHHWTNIQQALQELTRVVRPGGTVVVMDIYAPPVSLLDMHLQTIELLRDGSHVRDYTLTEWYAFLGQSCLLVRDTSTFKVEIDFESWVRRMKTAPVYVEAIRSFLGQAPAEVREYFRVSEDGSFVMDSMLIVCAVSRPPVS
jgi:ubiquinone/menaquinone biosynthesis C-methylase UbiE